MPYITYDTVRYNIFRIAIRDQPPREAGEIITVDAHYQAMIIHCYQKDYDEEGVEWRLYVAFDLGYAPPQDHVERLGKHVGSLADGVIRRGWLEIPIVRDS